MKTAVSSPSTLNVPPRRPTPSLPSIDCQRQVTSAAVAAASTAARRTFSGAVPLLHCPATSLSWRGNDGMTRIGL